MSFRSSSLPHLLYWTSLWPRARLHTTRKLCENNFYQVLGLEPNAAPNSIKKQYFQLSKRFHPDRNPDDPSAAERFLQISEAYATLSNPEKRRRYDRDNLPAHNAVHNPKPTGSYSSASAPFGARPASGLSRRRTQFKGPPPSFYRNGGWGGHEPRRQAHARDAARARSSMGGFGPGEKPSGVDHDVPHFDQEGHYRTQQSHEERFEKRRRENDQANTDDESDPDMFIRFLMVSGVIAVAYLPVFIWRRDPGIGKGNERK